MSDASTITIAPARFPEDVEIVRTLFREYVDNHIGHDIMDLPAVHICDRDDTLLEGINISSDHGLNGIDKLSRSDGGVAENVR